jgi:hypothetical protein
MHFISFLGVSKKRTHFLMLRSSPLKIDIYGQNDTSSACHEQTKGNRMKPGSLKLGTLCSLLPRLLTKLTSLKLDI